MVFELILVMLLLSFRSRISSSLNFTKNFRFPPSGPIMTYLLFIGCQLTNNNFKRFLFVLWWNNNKQYLTIFGLAFHDFHLAWIQFELNLIVLCSKFLIWTKSTLKILRVVATSLCLQVFCYSDSSLKTLSF